MWHFAEQFSVQKSDWYKLRNKLVIGPDVETNCGNFLDDVNGTSQTFPGVSFCFSGHSQPIFKCSVFVEFHRPSGSCWNFRKHWENHRFQKDAVRLVWLLRERRILSQWICGWRKDRWRQWLWLTGQKVTCRQTMSPPKSATQREFIEAASWHHKRVDAEAVRVWEPTNQSHCYTNGIYRDVPSSHLVINLVDKTKMAHAHRKTCWRDHYGGSILLSCYGTCWLSEDHAPPSVFPCHWTGWHDNDARGS